MTTTLGKEQTMKITKSKLRQIIMEELEREEEFEAPMPQVSPEIPAPAPTPPPAGESSPAGESTTAGLPYVGAGDFEGLAHAAISAIVQLAAEAGVEMDIPSGEPAMEPSSIEGDISLAELKKLIRSELLG